MITSFADLDALTTRFQQGYIKSESFTYGIISEFGCLSLMISSLENFKAFATKIKNGQLTGSWSSNITVTGTIGVEGRIGQLFRFLQENNSGLSILFAPNISESNPSWTAKEMNSSDMLVDMKCNQ